MSEGRNGRTTMERGKIVRRLLPLLIAMIVVAAAAGIASGR